MLLKSSGKNISFCRFSKITPFDNLKKKYLTEVRLNVDILHAKHLSLSYEALKWMAFIILQ